MNELLDQMKKVATELKALEREIAASNFNSKNSEELLGENPHAGFADLTEFKASVDRMRYITWLYMEAAARQAQLSPYQVPSALRQSMSRKVAV